MADEQRLSLCTDYADTSNLSRATAERVARRWVEQGRLPNESTWDGNELPDRVAVVLRIEPPIQVGPVARPGA